MSGFKPPGHFDFRDPAAWPTWKSQFQRFHVATELKKKDGDVQVSCLIYSMGAEAEKILSTFELSADEQTQYDTVMRKFDDYFTPKRNVIHERAQFHQRCQRETETTEEYVRALYELAKYADFADKDNTIRDRLVLGILDRELSEKLQLESDLTLDTAVKMARRNETVKQQLKAQRDSRIDAVHTEKTGGRGRGRDRQRGTGTRGRASSSTGGRGRVTNRETVHDCKYCGRTHQKGRCPAYGQSCHNCKGKGHFAKVCKKKRVAEVEEAGEEEEERYCLFSISTGEPPWTQKVKIGGHNFNFKIDTGADVSVISTQTYEKLRPRPVLQPTKAKLQSPGGILDCKGTARINVRVKDTVHNMTVYVVNSTDSNLLSREAAVRMGLIVRVEAVYGSVDENPIKTRPVKIELKEGAQPYSVHTARRISIPLQDKVKKELKKMEEAGIIEKIDEPTDWCAPIVPVIKPSGEVRICTDFKKLNQAVKRERYILPVAEDVLHKLKGSTIFSKLDASSGFFQVPLDSESAKLTTFITPEGRYFYKRLPQGISSAPEIFQKTMEEVLKGQENVICFQDDICVHSKNKREHERHLKEVFSKLEKAGVKLNKSKCELRRSEITWLGFVINKDGSKPDPRKVSAIVSMDDPTNVPELRRFLGMVQYLGRFLPSLSTTIRPLTELLEKDRAWTWGPSQAEAVQKVKELVTNAPTLTYFDPARHTTVSADASSYGLGAVLLQTHEDGDRPVAFASRSLTPAEKQYAQIEKECLAGTWACERFEKYLLGLPEVHLVTDHKPLVPLINSKDLSETPLRCQRLLLRLLKFNATASYTEGKNMFVADALSRAPLSETDETSHSDVEIHVREVEAAWPIKDASLGTLRQQTREDIELKCAMEYTLNGWPTYKEDVKLAARNLYDFKNELSVQDGLLLRGNQIVIPYDRRKDMLEKIHHGHMGVAKCRERANEAVWWPGIGRDIKERVSSCRHCLSERPSHPKEPLMTTSLPDRAFQKVAIDLFEFKKGNYLILTDYYSRYFEVGYLPNQTASTLVGKLKTMFARYGIPETVVSDNGPNLTSAEFAKFAESWNFQHVRSSPHHQQANGAAENRVKLAKQHLRQEDPCLAMLTYRATPIPELKASPAELAFGRKLRTTLPSMPQNLDPRAVDRKTMQQKDMAFKQKQKHYHDRHYGARPLPELKAGDPVLVKLDNEKGWKQEARVLQKVTPRSYDVKTASGVLRRNRRHLLRRTDRDNTTYLSPPTSTSLQLPSSTHADPDLPSLMERSNGGPPGRPPSPTKSAAVTSSPATLTSTQPSTSNAVSSPIITRSGRQVNLPARFKDE